MIVIENLSFIIKNKIILKDINLSINKGEFISIIGPNGAGKSTLLKILIGEYLDYKGKITIENTNHLKWVKKNILAYVPQKESFDRDFPATVMDIVLMGITGSKSFFKKFSKEDKDKAFSNMDLVDIYKFKDSYIGQLSGGEFQRVLLARALMCDSEYLFLDEPEAGIDKNGISKFYELLADLNKKNKTIILVSHDINTTTKYSTSIVCLNKTLHCHNSPELVSSEVIKKTYGEVIRLIERK